MYDNKVRLSKDVLEKAELIAETWGLKNARAAVEAVFRKYADDYLQRRGMTETHSARGETIASPFFRPVLSKHETQIDQPPSEALSELDDLLGL
jgi:hypothetical protein